MNKNILILIGIILAGGLVINSVMPFSFLQPGRTINVEYGSNVEIWNTLVNPYPYSVSYNVDIYKDGRLWQQGQWYWMPPESETEIQIYDYAITKNCVFDVRYKFTEDVGYETYRTPKTESGSIRYNIQVGENKNDYDIEPPFLPSPVDISDQPDIPDPVYDDTIQASIVVTKPIPLSSGVYEVLVDDLSTGKIIYWKLYQDDKLLYQGGTSFKSFRAYIDPGQISTFMIEVSNSGRVSTAYAVADTGTIPEPPVITDFGMVASISSDNLTPFGNSEYQVDIIDKSTGNIDQWILYQDGDEIYRGSKSFGTRNQIIPSGKTTIFMVELSNSKAVATAYTVIDTTEVDIPSFYFGGSNTNTNMIVLGVVALFVIWAFMGFKKPF